MTQYDLKLKGLPPKARKVKRSRQTFSVYCNKTELYAAKQLWRDMRKPKKIERPQPVQADVL
jgi:hypothetical protein